MPAGIDGSGLTMEHGTSQIGRSGDIHLATTFDRNKTGDVRRIQRNLMPRSRNHCSHGNVRVSSLGIVVEIYLAVNKTCSLLASNCNNRFHLHYRRAIKYFVMLSKTQKFSFFF
jgi:hypothetical protein